MASSTYSIGELSRRTDVKVPTIRFYEGRGFLPDPGRTAAGQRRYGAAELDRLGFVAHARRLGFSLETIEEMLALGEASGHCHEDVRAVAAAHLADVRGRIEQLRRLERELDRVVRTCDGAHEGPCLILEAMGDHAQCEGEH